MPEVLALELDVSSALRAGGYNARMITGTHVLLYSTDADADRAFIRDVLRFAFVDVGGGWLIFKTPPAEMAVHPADGGFHQQHSGERLLGAVIYLMCDDVRRLTSELAERHVNCSPLQEQEWGISTTIPLPSGGALGLYQPRHALAIDL